MCAVQWKQCHCWCCAVRITDPPHTHLFLLLGPVSVWDNYGEISVLLLGLGGIKGFSLLGVLREKEGRGGGGRRIKRGEGRGERNESSLTAAAAPALHQSVYPCSTAQSTSSNTATIRQHTHTDYRVLNGGGRQVFRLNIKFHGTLFGKAPELVGLDSEDCFPLATYKIIRQFSARGSKRSRTSSRS